MSDKKIIRQTIDYYVKNAEGPADAIDLLQDELDYAYTAWDNGKFEDAVDHLLEAWNIADEHELISARVRYPGPGAAFKRLVDRMG